MFKKIIASIMAAAMLAAMSTSVFASETEFVPPNTDLVESGEVVIPTGARAMFEKYVGEVGRGGIWRHGVAGITVYSNLSTVDYYDRVSVQPTGQSPITSGWSAVRGGFVSIEAPTSFVNGNRAFYDLRD